MSSDNGTVLCQRDVCGQDVTDKQDRIAWACGSVVHGPCDDALTDDIDIAHIRTTEGCVISMNGQGHLPCSVHGVGEWGGESK